MAENDVADLARQIVAGAGRLRAATCAWLLLVARFDAAEAYVSEGLASTARWLTHHCGIAHRTAVDHVRVARCLLAHEELAREMGAGRLSYSQLRAISRAARPDEHEFVSQLIEVARYGTVAQLESLVRGLRTVDDLENGVPPVSREYVSWRWADDSMRRLSSRLSPERGAVVTNALEKMATARGISMADALVELAEVGLAALADEKKPSRELRGDEQAAVVIHLDASRVPAGNAGVAEKSRPYARLSDGPGLPDRVVQRLLCAGRVRTIVQDHAGDVLDVGRSHRLVTAKQYRALVIRQQGHCAYPGCPNTRNLQAHHRIHWLHGGPTDMENLLLLCEPHHLGHHNGEFTIEAAAKGRFAFRAADGHQLGAPQPNPSDHGPMPSIDELYAHVDPATITTWWDGQRLDRAYAVAVLAKGRRQAEAPRSPS